MKSLLQEFFASDTADGPTRITTPTDQGCFIEHGHRSPFEWTPLQIVDGHPRRQSQQIGQIDFGE
jgi:hypothetical protein